MKKIIVSAATALAIAVGSFGAIAATTTASSADSRVVFRYDNGHHKGHYKNKHRHRHARACRTVITKKVVWRNHHRHVVRVKERRCW